MLQPLCYGQDPRAVWGQLQNQQCFKYFLNVWQCPGWPGFSHAHVAWSNRWVTGAQTAVEFNAASGTKVSKYKFICNFYNFFIFTKILQTVTGLEALWSQFFWLHSFATNEGKSASSLTSSWGKPEYVPLLSRELKVTQTGLVGD